MIEILLTIIILALIGLIAFVYLRSEKERASLIKAIMSKDLTEFVKAEEVHEEAKLEEPLPDAISIDDLDLSQAAFEKAIGIGVKK